MKGKYKYEVAFEKLTELWKIVLCSSQAKIIRL